LLILMAKEQVRFNLTHLLLSRYLFISDVLGIAFPSVALFVNQRVKDKVDVPHVLQGVQNLPTHSTLALRRF
jgi:hypothetical protein